MQLQAIHRRVIGPIFWISFNNAVLPVHSEPSSIIERALRLLVARASNCRSLEYGSCAGI